jgi:hypothetical protein
MAIRKLFVAISILMVFGGCARTLYYVPDPSSYDFRAIPEFSSTHAISLVRRGDFYDYDVAFTRMGRFRYRADLHQWTDVAITIAGRELSKRGMTIAENASKTLEMLILSTRSTRGRWGVRCYVTLKVVAGNGYTTTYYGEGPSTKLFWAADAAVIRVVEEMLKDKNIVNYLIE